MSVDVYVYRRPHPDCNAAHSHQSTAELNITYNLSPMLREAGFMGWSATIGQPARQVGAHIIEVLDRMAQEPERWRDMNPKNGWGTYDGCIQGRMQSWAQRARDAHEDDIIGGFL